MGVDFSHGDAHFSYSGFGRFRDIVAKEIGLDLRTMYGFGGQNSWDLIQDPLKILLNHSDCDGEISAENCALLYPRLLEVLDSIEVIDDHTLSIGKQLVEGLKEAAELEEDFEFC